MSRDLPAPAAAACVPRRAITGAVLILSLICVRPTEGAPIVAFQNNFNHDTVGAEPSVDPPLDPSGDYMQVNPVLGSILVRSSMGNLSDQPLEVDNASASGQFSFRCFVDPSYQDCDTYTVRWRSLMTRGLFYVVLAVRDPSQHLAAAVEYRDGGALSFNGSGNPLDVGWSTNTSQLFEMTLDMTTQTVSLSVDGAPQSAAQGLPFYQTGITTLSRLQVECAGGYGLVIDDIEIIGDGCPAAPVETTTWGRVKASYR
jgi:hypothetical protein